jgi:hypothetical protein
MLFLFLLVVFKWLLLIRACRKVLAKSLGPTHEYRSAVTGHCNVLVSFLGPKSLGVRCMGLFFS